MGVNWRDRALCDVAVAPVAVPWARTNGLDRIDGGGAEFSDLAVQFASFRFSRGLDVRDRRWRCRRPRAEGKRQSRRAYGRRFVNVRLVSLGSPENAGIKCRKVWTAKSRGRIKSRAAQPHTKTELVPKIRHDRTRQMSACFRFQHG